MTEDHENELDEWLDDDTDADSEVIEKVGVPWHKARQHPTGPEILDLFDQGFSRKQTAKYFGVSTSTIHRRLKRFKRLFEHLKLEYETIWRKNHAGDFEYFLRSKGIRDDGLIDWLVSFYESRE